MELSKPGAAFVRALEGVVLHYYLDPVGVGTIGEGFTWRSMAFREWWARNKPGMKFGPGATMTREECDAALIYLFKHEYGAAVNNFLGKRVPQNVFDGMGSTTYNLGSGSLKRKWAAAAKRGDYDESGRLLRTTGVTAGGKRLSGLVKRRKEEAELIATGDYTIGGTIGTSDPMGDGVLKRGERGIEVKGLQQQLADLGFYNGRIDGIFGHGTEAAVVEFQRSRGLAIDGWAGPKTLAALNGSPLADYEPAEPTEVGIPTSGRKSPAMGIAAIIAAVIAAVVAFLKAKGLI